MSDGIPILNQEEPKCVNCTVCGWVLDTGGECTVCGGVLEHSRERVEEYAEAVSLFLTYIKHADTEDYCKQFDVVEKLIESILDRLDKHRSEHEQ